MTMTHKFCTKCQCLKSCDDFIPCAKRHDGLSVWCRECHKKASMASYQRHKEERREKRRQGYAKKKSKRAASLTETGPRCACGRKLQSYDKGPCAWCRAERSKQNRMSAARQVIGAVKGNHGHNTETTVKPL